MSYKSKKVTELRDECTKLGLDSKGTKDVLIARLEAHGSGGAEEQEEEEQEEVKPTKASKAAAAAKKKSAPAKKKAGGKKRGKEEEEEEKEEEEKEAVVDVKAELAKKAKASAKPAAGQRKKDPGCPLPGEVYEDYQATLNQTNIGANNNKFYIVELHQVGASYRVWTHWGRVGESGQNKAESFGNVAQAVAAFEKKFKEKSANAWANRDNFVPKAGKYTLIEMAAADDDADEIVAKLDALDAAAPKASATAKCKLDKQTQGLVGLIFNHDMFKGAMAALNIDVQKMPLGKLSHAQILKGYETLEELERAIEEGRQSDALQLTSQFYTQIPHSFGRSQPPRISTVEEVQKKYDMLNILGDIQSATSAEKEANKGKKTDSGEAPHPLDVSYASLDCTLTPVDPKSAEYKLIEEYTSNTNKGGWRQGKILEIFEVDRHSEGGRFKQHDKVENRKLLWHGTNVAVVAAILKTGLRIMPHSGGRVGKGIYSASENSKSAGYVGTTGDNIGIMFLNEVVLGKEHHIVRDDSSLTKAPAGCHSIIAQGQTDPDPKGDKTLVFDGHKVVVPAGKPVSRAEYANSNFSQSEFLVYQESQVRIRYLLKLKF